MTSKVKFLEKVEEERTALRESFEKLKLQSDQERKELSEKNILVNKL